MASIQSPIVDDFHSLNGFCVEILTKGPLSFDHPSRPAAVARKPPRRKGSGVLERLDGDCSEFFSAGGDVTKAARCPPELLLFIFPKIFLNPLGGLRKKTKLFHTTFLNISENLSRPPCKAFFYLAGDGVVFTMSRWDCSTGKPISLRPTGEESSEALLIGDWPINWRTFDSFQILK